MLRSSIFLVLLSSFEFLQSIPSSCPPPMAKRSVNIEHHASIRSRFDGLECSKVLNLQEICLQNNTDSQLAHLTSPNLQNTPIDSCQRIQQQDQYLLQLSNDSAPFPVVCVKHHRMTGDGWLVIQQRVDGAEDFHRNWPDYRDGFGDLRRDFWLGLEHIHQITNSARHELLVEIVTVDARFYQARYSAFEIGNEQEKYILKRLGSYTGTAGDALRAHVGMEFSTFDSDNDRSHTTFCAVKYSGGWWFDSCIVNGANLNGRRYSNLSHGYDTIRWHTIPQPVQEMQFARMMLRKTV